ncbi:tetratricopeptide repeat protein [Gelidibacter salicanalis]|uniref:Tetratricopeptide repeat protein n=1 Tax=Gelidibacter salicanalis TaxID=291193 RepID=A0A5C7AJG7_9FLAO|nr:tetratricopeptide repeat protein [Gelidibacter salicanalis]TXE08487.1 tetratricopeptide repeat protein [Gelidibacter salicanalis]
MNFKDYIVTCLFAIVFVAQTCYAQVDPNQKPTDDLGNVEDQFQEHFFEALKQQGIENYQRAIDALLKCKAIDDKSVVYYQLGKNYNKLKNFGAAEDALKRAVSKEPENEWYLDELYDVYNQQGDTKKAIKTVKQLVKYHPDYRQDLASLYIKSKEYKEAIKLLDELDKEFGISADRDYLRNQVYTITGRDEERIENLQERLDKNPEDETNYLTLIYRYSETGETEQAFHTAQQLLKVHPESKLVHLALYKFYLDNNQAESAIASMQIVLTAPEINPDAKTKVLNDFINFVAKNPQHEKDLIDVTAMIDESKSFKTLVELAQYYLKLEDKSKALMYFEDALKLEPTNFAVIKDALLLQIDLDFNEKAVVRSREALELFPAQPILYLIKGVAHNNLKQSKDAVASLESGLDYVIEDPKMEADFYTQLSMAYKLNNNNTKSESFAKKAAALKNPNE